MSSRSTSRSTENPKAHPSVARVGRRTHLPAVELALGRHGNARVRRLTLMLQSARPIHGRNVAHRQSHRRTKARSGRRTHHSSFVRLACAYLWNVAENRFFRSLPLAPFFTNFAALLALFTFSSARDATSCAIRQSKALSVVVARGAARRSRRRTSRRSRANTTPSRASTS